MNKKIIPILLILTLWACTHADKKVATIQQDFHLPIVVQQPTKDTIDFFKADHLTEAYFKFFGKYKFTDTIQLAEHRKRDTTYKKDFIWEYSRPRKNDTLTTDGFQIFANYKTTIYNREEYLKKGNYYYPVYVVNETSRTKVFIGKDSHVFGLQEAVDTSEYDTWRPIEGKGFDFCGNGYFGLKVHPGEFILFLVPKYDGVEKGLMRIRLMVGENIYLSQSFEGIFNRKQFDIQKDKWFYDRLKNDKASAIQWTFYGATPKGYDKVN